MKNKKKKIVLSASCLVLFLIATVLGAFLYFKNTIVGTYVVKSIKGEYEGISISAEYVDDCWKVEDSSSLLSECTDLNTLLSNMDNSIITLTIAQDFSYSISISNEKENGVLHTNNIKFSKEGIVFEQKGYEIVYKNKAITMKSDVSEIVFEKR